MIPRLPNLPWMGEMEGLKRKAEMGKIPAGMETALRSDEKKKCKQICGGRGEGGGVWEMGEKAEENEG